MDAATLRRALFDLFKFDPKQFSVRGSGTSFLVSLLRQGGATAKYAPFELIDVSVIIDGDFTPKIRVKYGTVNGIVPDGMSAGDVPTYVLDIDIDDGFVYLIVSVDTDDYSIIDLSIDFAATVPDNTGDTFYLQIGSFHIADGKMSLAQAISGSQSFKWCGDPLFAFS